MSDAAPTLVIRADASQALGIGHVMRCLALAQAWMARVPGGSVCWASAELPQDLSLRLAREGVFARMLAPGNPVADAEATRALAVEAAADWVVLDRRFDTAYAQVVASAARVLVWDDAVHTDHAPCGLVLNQNIHATPALYPTVAPERVLAGPRFAQLRREFWPLRSWKRSVATTGRRVLVTLGGSDPTSTTRRVVEALAGRAAGLEVTVVVGAAARFDPVLFAEIERAGFRLVTDPPSMPELMAHADVAVAACGSTSWELLFMGLPTIAITVAEDQRATAAGLHSAGAAITLGWHAELDFANLAGAVRGLAANPARRRELSALGRTLVDGDGGGRVVDAMRGAAKVAS